MNSTRDDLRIRLEGQLEVVEGAIDAHRKAAEELEGDDWVTDSGWPTLAVESEATVEAVEALRRVAPDDERLNALEAARARTQRLALARLSKLGITEQPEGERATGTVSRLLEARPVFEGTMSLFDDPRRVHWVTEMTLGFLASGLLCFGSGLTQVLQGWWCLLLTTPLLVPVIIGVRRRWHLREIHFLASAGSLTIAGEQEQAWARLLERVQMTRSPKGGWRVTWFFKQRPAMASHLGSTEASVLRALLKKNEVPFESLGGE